MSNNYQNPDQFKKKRQQFSSNIRKGMREQLFSKRRNIGKSTSNNINTPQNIIDSLNVQLIKTLHNSQITQPFNILCQSSLNGQYINRLKSIIGVRKLLSTQNQQYLTYFTSNYIHKFIQLFSSQQPQIRLQVSWIFSYLTYQSNMCHLLIQMNVLPKLQKFLTNVQLYTIDHILVCIGNLSADGPQLRDNILNNGTLQLLYPLLKNYSRSQTYLNTIWVITNLCRGNPLPKHNLIDKSLQIICQQFKNKQLINVNDQQVSKVITDMLATLSLLSDKSVNNCDRIINQGALPYVFNYALSNKNYSISAVKIIGNLGYVGQYQTDALINNGFLQLSFKLLSSSKKTIRRQICWILSNIAAGNKQQVRKLMSNKQLIQKLVQMLKNDIQDIKQQIVWIFANIGHLGQKTQVLNLYDQIDIMRLYIQNLSQENNQLLVQVLKCINKVLSVGNKILLNGQNIMLNKFMQYGGSQKVVDLQFHKSSSVYKCATNIITKFFQVQQN